MAKDASRSQSRVQSSARRLSGRASSNISSRKTPAKEQNTIGYQQRLERRAAKAETEDANDFGNSYEYKDGKNRRSNVAMRVDREERQGHASGSEEDEADSSNARVRRIASNIMDADYFGEIASEDDEELDSDVAFEGESDEDRFGAFKFSLSQKSKTRQKPSKTKNATADLINLDEAASDENPSSSNEAEEDDDEDEDDEEINDGGNATMSLSAMLDATPEPDSESESGQGQDDESDLDDILAPSDQEFQTDALENLSQFIGGLSTDKDLGSITKPSLKRAGQNNEGPDAKKRRLRFSERTEAGPENEFAARGAGTTGKLLLEDLLTGKESSSRSSKRDQPQDLGLSRAAGLLRSNKAASRTVDAPLQTRHQERLDREAAYETTKGEVEKWAPTMRRVKEAEHLSFPLQKAVPEKPSVASLTSSFTPSNEMESAVDRLLSTAKLHSTRAVEKAETDALGESNITPEQVAQRRQELLYMRELLFRSEAKAKRVAKIKSKTYRKLRRRAGAGEADISLEDLDKLDPDAAQSKRLKLERDRALERATMRHKNTGKWAQKMLSGGGKDMDVDQRKEIARQLQRGEQLRRRIAGRTSDDEEDDSDADSDYHSGDSESGQKKVVGSAYNELEGLEKQDPSAESFGTSAHKKSGVWDMKFMKEAAERDDLKVKGTVDDFRDELGRLSRKFDGSDSDEDDELTEEVQTPSTQVEGNSGRMIFRPAAGTETLRATIPSKPGLPTQRSDASSTTLQSSESPVSPVEPTFSKNRPESTQSNPWLNLSTQNGTRLSRKGPGQNISVSKHSEASVKSQAVLDKRKNRTEEARQRDEDDALVELDPGAVLTRIAAADSTNRDPKRPSSKETPDVESMSDSDDSVEGDDEDQGTKKNPKAFRQRDLVAKAFAGDNVVEEFNARKLQDTQAEAPKIIDTSLPGWGSWGGRGLKKQSKKTPDHLIKHVAGKAPSERQDARRAHVIISEKKNKKAINKYSAKDLPFPYTSKEQFEKSLATPIGTEWNTRTAFQKGTLPRVVKKMGTIIDPLEKLS